MWDLTWRTAKRLVISVVGVTVLLVGIAMIVLPGPAIVVIPAGLAILATEFVWAKRLLERIKQRTAQAVQAVRGAAGAPCQTASSHSKAEQPVQFESRQADDAGAVD